SDLLVHLGHGGADVLGHSPGQLAPACGGTPHPIRTMTAPAADLIIRPMAENDRGTSASRGPAMSLRGAVFLGIGAMVGAGIFALLGEAGAVAGSAVWLSFLVAGV